MTPLLAVPNVSEGRDGEVIDAIGSAFVAPPSAADEIRLLDVHSDADHNRSVFTLAGPPHALAAGLVAGGREAVARIDMRRHRGLHPCVGALDVAPVVHLDTQTRGAACAAALVVADELARQLDLPVLLYGPLAGGRSRAELRAGGRLELARRLAEGELSPDFGPPTAHPRAGATLVAARPPLVAFNLELSPPATEADAREVAAAVRAGGAAGLAGVRAIGLWLEGSGVAQVSCNVEDPIAVPLVRLVEAVRARAAVEAVELVGLVPRAALQGFPEDVAVRGRPLAGQVIEHRLGL